jgi:hypothetical protein
MKAAVSRALRLGLLGSLPLVAALAAVCVSPAVAQDKDKPPVALEPVEALEKAQVDGKYRMLLAQFKVEGDWMESGAFRDAGFRVAGSYADQEDLPAGHWVYVYPNWYIWRDKSDTPIVPRSWGPEQVIGPPDTLAAGDITTAWASRTQDDQEEWLLVEFEQPVMPAAVMVHETYNPGAVSKVSLFKLDGEEVVAWEGKDPVKPDDGKGVALIPVKADFPVARVKVYIDSPAVASWNEIDAIGLRDDAGTTHWTVACEASTTYAQQEVAVAPIAPPDVMQARLTELESEVSDLKDLVDTLRAELKAKESGEERMTSLEEELRQLKEELKKMRDEK